MVAMVVVLGLFIVFIPIVDGSITNGFYIHHRYSIQHSFMGGLKEGYQGECIEEAIDLFVSRFEMSAPDGFEYTIDVLNCESSPKLLQMRVKAVSYSGVEMVFEKSLVEEMQNEAGS